MADGSSGLSETLDNLRERQLRAWERGERLLVESLASGGTPPLQENELLELIFAEVMLRGECGEVCDSEEYLQRFPQFAESLTRLFSIHEAMEASADELGETVLAQKVNRPKQKPVRRSSDRNLLFGIMALQMDFISRNALVDALRDWTTQKDKPLGQILVERGDLAAARRELLEPVVDEHVKRHDSDPAASLASISSVIDGAVDWHQVHDVDIAESLASRRLARNAHPSGSSNTSARTTGNTGASRFRVLRPHAEGGLGCVLVAQDEELHREVALKEIKRQFAGDIACRNRFTLEAEVTGGLEHPGIVPVYGLGQYSDGRPYYAMRFIRGDSLKEAIEQFHGAAASKSALASLTPAKGDKPTFVSGPARVTAATTTEHPAQSNVSREAFASLEFRKLLGRFIDVCQAIEYAHSRGVLHRDLKPGNIMLGKYGETLVVDWGLAKVAGKDDRFTNVDEATLVPSSGSSIENTAAGSVIGTPAYMSPEQASGKLENLGPTTDVYSLGATLYHVLTGRAAFSKLALPELLACVQRGEFPHPRELNSSIPKSLEAICLKAMSLRQEDRYMSAAAAAEDLEHWLADEPVDALTETSLQQVSRWARRHRSWATAGLFAVAAIAVVASIAFFIVMGSRNEALLAKDAAIAAQLQESIAREKATTLADANQQLASNETLAKEEALASAARESSARAEIETQLHQATALRLASHVQIERKESPELSTLLAIEAVESTRSRGLPVVPLAEQALRDVLGSLSGIGISGSGIAFAPDSDRFVCGSQVWNLSASGPRPHSVPLEYAAIRDTYGENSGRMFRNTVQVSCGSMLGITPLNGRLLTLSQQPGIALEIWDLNAEQPADKLQLLTQQGRMLTASEWFQESERRPLERFRGPGAADVNAKQTSILISANSQWAFTSDGLLCFDLDAENVSAKPLQPDLRAGEKILEVSDNGRALVASSQQGVRVILLGENQELLAKHELANSGSTGDSPGVSGWSAEPLQLVTSRFTGTQLAEKGRVIWFWQLQGGQFKSRELGEFPQSEDWHVQFSPQGQFVALVLRGQRAEIRACEGGAEHMVYQFNGRPRHLVFSPDERWVVAGNDDGTVERLDLQDAVKALKAPGMSQQTSEPGVASNSIKQYLVEEYFEARTLQSHQQAITALTFAQEGRLLISASADGVVKVITNPCSGDEEPSAVTLPGGDSAVVKIAVSLDGHWLAATHSDQRSRMWRLPPTAEAPGMIPLAFQPKWMARSASPQILSQDGGQLESGGLRPDGSLSLLVSETAHPDFSPESPVDLEHLLDRLLLRHPAAAIGQATGNTTEDPLGGDDKVPFETTLWLRHLKTAAPEFISDSGQIAAWEQVVTVEDPDRDGHLAVEARLRALRKLSELLPRFDRKIARTLEDDSKFAISSNGETLAFAQAGRLTCLRGDGSGPFTTLLDDVEAEIDSLAFDPAGQWLATADDTQGIHLWDFRPGANNTLAEVPRVVIPGGTHWAAVSLSSGGRWLAAVDQDAQFKDGPGCVQVWDLENPAAEPLTLRDVPNRMIISSDGRWLASACENNLVGLWDLDVIRSDQERVMIGELTAKIIRGHESPISVMTLSPDDRWLITGTSDGTIRLWDLTSTDLSSSAVVLRRHAAPVVVLSVSDDHRWLFSADRSGQVLRWELNMEDLVELARRTVGRTLTEDERRQFLIGPQNVRETLRR